MPNAPDWFTTDNASLDQSTGPGPKPKPAVKPTLPAPDWLTGGGTQPTGTDVGWLTGSKPTLADVGDTTSDATSTGLATATKQLAATPAPAATTDEQSGHAIAGLAALLQNPNITPEHRARIETLLHNARRQFAGEQIPTPDPLSKQFEYSAAQAALDIPARVSHLAAGLISGQNAKPTAIERYQAGIAPTVDPANPIGSAIAQAGGEAVGSLPAQAPAFEAGKLVATAATGLAPEAIQVATKAALDKVAGNVTEKLVPLVGQENATALGTALRNAPLNAASGVTMQAMTDPKSLSTSKGLAMAVGMGALASLDAGQHVADLEAKSRAAMQAKEVADATLAGQTKLDPLVAKGQAEIAEREAMSAARRNASKAWNALTPQLRKVMHPLADEAPTVELTSSWKDLPKEVRTAIATNLRQGVDEANAKADAQATASQPQPEAGAPTTGEPAPAQPVAEPPKPSSPPQGPPEQKAPVAEQPTSFKEGLSDAKTGKPQDITVYRGVDVGRNPSDPGIGGAIYTSIDPRKASRYGAEDHDTYPADVHKMQVHLKNPLVIESSSSGLMEDLAKAANIPVKDLGTDEEIQSKAVPVLRSMGYDGVIVDGGTEVIVFNPENKTNVLKTEQLNQPGVPNHVTLKNEFIRRFGDKSSPPGKVVGSIAPSDDVLRDKLADAIKLKPEEIHPRITELENQLAEQTRMRQAAERRANVAERANLTDKLTGLQNDEALRQARPSMDVDPNVKWILMDLRNVHPDNEIRGRDVVDNRLKDVATAIKSVIPQTDRIFRGGSAADEFAIGTTSDNPDALAKAIQTLVPDDVIPGTKYRTGLRYGVGKTFAEADAAMSAAKSLESDRGRPVEPPSQTGGDKPVVGAKTIPEKAPVEPSKFKDLSQLTTLDQLDSEIDRADDMFDKGKIDDATYDRRLNDIFNRKQEIKSGRINKKATVQTRAQMDKSAVEGLTVNQLRSEQSRLNGQILNATGTEREGLTHDLFVVQRELRWRKPVEELTDKSIEKHANELKDEWLDAQGDPARKTAIEARMKQVDAEIVKRAKPNITDVLGNEDGFITTDHDPLETKIDPSLPEYTKRILKDVKIGPLDQHTMKGMGGIWTAKDALYSKTVRGIHAFDVYDKIFGLQEMPAVKSAGKWAELTSGSAGRAQAMIRDGSFRIDDAGNIQWNGDEGLAKPLNPLKGKINQLRAFFLASRTLDAAKAAKVTGIDVLDATREVQNASPEIKAAAKAITNTKNGSLQYLMDTGAFSPDAVAAWTKLYDIFAPIDRVLDAKPSNEPVATVGPKARQPMSASGIKETTVKEFKGSKAPIIDPLRQIVDRIRREVAMADKNRLSGILVQAAEANPEFAKGIIQRESAGPITLDPEEQARVEGIKKLAADNNIPITDEAAQQIGLMANSKRLKGRSDIMYYIRDGKLERWRIAPELAAAWQGLKSQELNEIVKILGFVPQMAKTGITDNPAFGLINAFRDTFDASIQSKYGFRLGLDTVLGFRYAITDNAVRREARAAMGTAGGITGRAVESTDRALRSVLPKTLAEKLSTVVSHPIDALRELSIPFEESTRIGEFVRARQAGAPAMDAALAAQRVTTNFRNRGLAMQGWSHVVMFLNPAIQSLDTAIRAVASQPKRVLTAGLLGISLPSVYLWAANKDDQDIQELRKSQYGAGYWYWRRNDGSIGRVSKPFIFGSIFGNGVEDALDALYDKDPTGGRRFITALADQVGFNVVPSTLNLTLGLINNKDFSTGGEIEPNSEGDVGQLISTERARITTGPTARQLSRITDALPTPTLSPAKIEFLVRNAMGTLGQDALRGIDMLNDARATYPASPRADAPIVGRFTANFPTMSAASVQRFYRFADQVEQIDNTRRKYEATADPKLEDFMKSHTFEIAAAQVVAEGRQQIAQLRSMSDAFAKLPASALSPQEKRQLIDNNTRAIIQIARNYNEALDNIKQAASQP